MSFKRINDNLVKTLIKKYPDMFKEVLSQDYCDIDYSFLGFIDTYYYLSKLIPRHWVVIDFGCAFNPQAYFFRKHKKYIAVDSEIKIKRFYFQNTTLYECSILEYLKQEPPTKEVFAICNYVSSADTKLVREYYPNCYVFYPSGNPIFFRKRLGQEVFNFNLSEGE